MGAPLIELRQLALQFHPEQPPLFQNLDFRLEDPCWAALVGPSGSGKTSLIHCLAGLGGGSVTLDGQPIGNYPPAARIGRRKHSCAPGRLPRRIAACLVPSMIPLY